MYEYLQHAHPDRVIKCIFVDNYDGTGSGPGHSLLCCKDELQCPFVLTTADTLTPEAEKIEVYDHNWMGICDGMYHEREEYCTAKIEHECVSELYDKVPNGTSSVFIGLAGVYDFILFWEGLEDSSIGANNEKQLLGGFQKLIDECCDFRAHYYYDWVDTGTKEDYVCEKIGLEDQEQFDFSKANEHTYKIDGRLIKYFEDKDIVEKRCQRALKLGDSVPEIVLKTDSFFSYDMVPGEVLYDCYDAGVTKDFLTWCIANLWASYPQKEGSGYEASFRLSCELFYKKKTKERLAKFYMKYPSLVDQPTVVNGLELPSLGSLLTKIDWDSLIGSAIPVMFHGDLQYDNVVKTGDGYKLIDWRQSFGNHLVGDLYYDLAKMYGGLTLPYRLIKSNKFEYSEVNGDIKYDFDTSNNLSTSREVFEKFVDKCGFDLHNIKLLRALIYLNMSPLHEHPFDKMLYYMSRYYLNEVLNEG